MDIEPSPNASNSSSRGGGVRAFGTRAGAAELLELPAAASGDLHSAVQGVFEQLLPEPRPAAIYTGLRSYRGHCFLHLERHLERMARNVAALGWQPEVDAARIRAILQAVTRAARARGELGDWRFRIDRLSHPAPLCGQGCDLLVAMAPYQPVPQEILSQGAQVAIEPLLKRVDPHIKTSDWVVERRACATRAPDAYEHLLVDGPRVLECSSSNFYGVRSRCLFTAGAGVLEGITRSIVLELAEGLGLEVDFGGLTLEELPSLDEAFLTSSTREVVGIARVGAIPLGKPGPVTLALAAAYRDYAAQHALPALDDPTQ